MTMTPFKTVVQHQPGLAIIDLHGELTAAADSTLQAAYTEAESHSAAILLNFSQVDHINSSGMGLIIDLIARASRAQQTLKVYGLKPNHRKIFVMIGLTGFIDILSDEASGLGSASTPS